MTAPRCSQCKWLLDVGAEHGTLECRVRSAAQLEASRVSSECPDSIKRLPMKRGVDARALRQALRDVVALREAS